jgi:hypothetical protein
MALTKVSTGVVDMSGNTGGLVIAKGTTAQQPTCNPPTTSNLGSIRENTTENKVEVCTSTGWQFLEEVGPTFIPLTVDYLVVAGGGGGAGSFGNGNGTGGGGAGGLITTITYGGTENVFSGAVGTPYDITVGYAGAGGISSGINSPNNNNRGLNGGNSKFNIAESIGGGGGGAVSTSYLAGANGGSGGGGTPYSNSGGDGTLNQGNSGGIGSSTPGSANRYRGGGGGGASQAGASGDASGNGGNGATNAITVSSGTGPYYAGGGGGGVYSTGVSAGTGGSGIGGNGSANGGNGYSGLVNTGSGGGGAGALYSPSYTGGAGGSGVVILRYPSAYDINFQTGVGFISSTATLSATSEKVTTITAGSGTITFA